MFCRHCGKPSEASLCPECAAAEEVTPEVVAPEETTPETISPEEAAPTDEPLMELGLDQEPQKKKKSKKALWISLVAVVSALAVTACLLWNWLRYTTKDPVEWYQEVEMESAKTANDAIASLYGMLIKGEGPSLGNYNTSDTTLELQLNKTLLDAVVGLIPNSADLPVDLDKLQNLSVSTKFTATEDMLHLVLSAGDQLDFHVYADMPNSKIYLQLPQAQEQALVFDTKELFGLDLSVGLEGLLNAYQEDSAYAGYEDYYGDYSYDYGTTVSGVVVKGPMGYILDALQDQTFKGAMPSEDEFQGMLDRFSEAAISVMAETAQKDRRTVEVGDGSETQNVLSTTIDEGTLRQMVKSVLTVAKDDATVKKILDAASAYLNANGENVDLYSMYTLAIPSLITELDQPIHGFGIVTLDTYLNDDDEVMGRSMMLSGFDDVAYTFSYNVVDDGDTDYFKVCVPELVINGTITEEDDQTTTEFSVPLGREAFRFMIKTAPNQAIFRVTPPADLVKEALQGSGVDIPSMLLNNLSVEMGIECPTASQAKLSFSVLTGETRLATVSLNETLSKEAPALPGDAIDGTDVYAITKWLWEVDRDALVAALTNLGLKEDLAGELISQLVQGAVYELT